MRYKSDEYIDSGKRGQSAATRISTPFRSWENKVLLLAMLYGGQIHFLGMAHGLDLRFPAGG